jgi:tetratricopeptide (TPR) repeat protein
VIPRYKQLILPLAEKHKSAGNTYYAKKEYAAALSCYAEALKLNPRFKEAFHNTGMCHYFLKNYETAITFFDKALAIDPHYQNAKANKTKAQAAFEKQPTLEGTPELK